MLRMSWMKNTLARLFYDVIRRREKMKCPLVSLVVPVYRVEKYLDRCVQSLLHQTYKMIEIILVDDGSDDCCPEICDRYASMYDNVMVVHQTNRGLPGARNVGLDYAKGDYIQFCDSDDEIGPELIERAVRIASAEKTDVLMFGYETFPNGQIVFPGIKPQLYKGFEEMLPQIATWHSGNELCFCWRFFYKSEFLKTHKIRFDESILFGEDVPFNINVLCEAERIMVVGECYYRYRIDNSTSIMRTSYKPNLEELIQRQYEKKKYLNEKYHLIQNKDWMADMAFYYITGFSDMLFRNAMNGPEAERKDAIKRIVRMPAIRENLIKYIKYGGSLTRCGRKKGIFWILCIVKMDLLIVRFVEESYA